MNINFFKNTSYRPVSAGFGSSPPVATPAVLTNTNSAQGPLGSNPFDQMNWSTNLQEPAQPTGIKAKVLAWLQGICQKLQAPSVSQAGALAPAIDEVFRREMLRDQYAPVDYVGGPNAAAKVAVIDAFSYVSDTRLHGDHVTGVLQREADLRPSELQRLRYDANPYNSVLLSPGPESPDARLSAFIQQDSLFDLKERCKMLRELGKNPNLQVINLSIGLNSFGTAEYLYRKALRDEDQPKNKAEFLFEAVGLPHSYDADNLKKLRQALHDRVHTIRKYDHLVWGARQEFSELTARLKESGVSVVVAAGNDQQQVQDLRREGFKISDEALVSDYQNRHSVVVGAIDDKGTPSPFDDTLAPFSTPSPYTQYLANGTYVDVDPFGGGQQLSGTSFAAPIVSAQILKARREHPEAGSESMSFLIARPMGVPGSNLPVVGSNWV